MGINLGIDTTSDWEEELRIEDIGGGVIVYRPPTTKLISAVSLEMTGKRKNDGAVRDFMESVLLSEAEVRERAYGADEEVLDAELAGVLESGRFVDMDFLIDRMKDPHYTFNAEQYNKLVYYLIEQRSGFPTKPSSDSSTGPTSTGRASTATSRRVESTPTASSRRASSRSSTRA